jgi:SNF2 family DNA or RNA helicase
MLGEVIRRKAHQRYARLYPYGDSSVPLRLVNTTQIDSILTPGHTLREFQYNGIQFLAERGRALLADDPRVGKTIQVLVANELLEPRDTLIVCPKNAIGVWRNHIAEWLGKESRTYSVAKRKASNVRASGYVICNYAMLKEVIRLKSHWTTIIWDEAHHMRNPKLFGYNRKTGRPHTFAHANKLTAVNEFFLTGTPINKSAGDLWTMLNRINPRRFPAYWPFVRRYAHMINNGFAWQPEGIKDEDLFAADMAPYMLRRRKADVLTELPEKLVEYVPLTMTDVQKRYYKDIATDMMAELENGDYIMAPTVATKLGKLRQLLVSPRLLGISDNGAAIDGLMEDLEVSPYPSLIYTPYKAGVRFISQMLEAAGWQTLQLMGGMKEDQMDLITSSFANGQTERRALIATVQMGTAWDASAAQYEYFLGYDWDPNVNFQAEERPFGRGLKGTLFVRYYYHDGTVDRHVRKINEKKTTIQKLLMDNENILGEI